MSSGICAFATNRVRRSQFANVYTAALPIDSDINAAWPHSQAASSTSTAGRLRVTQFGELRGVATGARGARVERTDHGPLQHVRRKPYRSRIRHCRSSGR